jgi:hypothetical protein
MQALRNAQVFVERHGKIINEAIRYSTELSRFDDVLRQIEANRKTVIEPAIRMAQQAADLIAAALPENWRDVDDIFPVLGLAETGTIPLIWAPRADIVAALAASGTHAAREQILVDRRNDVLVDVDAVFQDAAGSGNAALQQAYTQAGQALASAEANLDVPAQAAFASALGHVLEGALGFDRPGAAYRLYAATKPDDTDISELRLAFLQVATANALTDTKFAPSGFNRHGTQHGNPAYLTQPSMLGAALLVVGWLRELRWLEDNEPVTFTTLTTP